MMVLSEGRIVESGGHQELISARGLYSELYVRELSRNPSTPTATGTARRVTSGTGLSPSTRWLCHGEPSRPTAANDASRRPTGWQCRRPPAASRRRLPGLASALSPELTARRVERRRSGRALRSAGRRRGRCGPARRDRVAPLPVGRSDGTVISEHTVLARVYPSADVAGRSLPSDEGDRRRTPTRPIRGERGGLCRRRRTSRFPSFRLIRHFRRCRRRWTWCCPFAAGLARPDRQTLGLRGAGPPQPAGCRGAALRRTPRRLIGGAGVRPGVRQGLSGTGQRASAYTASFGRAPRPAGSAFRGRSATPPP